MSGNAQKSIDIAAAAADLEALRIQTKNNDDEDPDLWNPPPKPDCPICMLPLPIGPQYSAYMSCCGKIICGGCRMEHARIVEAARQKKKRDEGNTSTNAVPLPDHSCPFCRKPAAKTYTDVLAKFKNRMEANDPRALFNMSEAYAGRNHFLKDVVKKNEKKAWKLLLRAAELGSVEAYGRLADYYRAGMLLDKERKYLELATKKGDAMARNDLGLLERKSGNSDLAFRNWRVAAAAGLQESLKHVKIGYTKGHVSKEEFAETLRAFQAAQEEEWSEERERLHVRCLEKRVKNDMQLIYERCYF